MGTLLNQGHRNYQHCDKIEDVISEIQALKDIQKKTGLTYDQVLETCKMLELRRKNTLYVENGDTFDEQMAGFGELLKELNRIFSSSFGETLSDSEPAFLEAIAMELGASQGSTIKDALYNMKDQG